MKRLLLLLLPVVILSCKKPETLKEAYKDHFLIGAAITTGAYMSVPAWKSYDEEIMNNFNLLVPENALKPEAIAHRDPAKYNFKYGDAMVDYTREKGITAKGHTLLWHQQSPGFMASSSMSKEQVQANLYSHIKTTLEHYKSDIPIWDVVNEAISDSPEQVYRTTSNWYEGYGGPEFISDAFRFAREIQPDAQLYYNDYSVWVPHKREKIVKMINDLDLIENGMTGIGIQAHWNLNDPSPEMIQETIDTFAEMGLRISFTELDIDCYNSDPNAPEKPYDEELEEALAQRYEEIFEVFRKNSDVIDAVVLWGIGDDHSWLHRFCTKPIPYRTNYPLLFDWAGKPKEAYYRILWY